jgi:hypothetical protein
VTENRRIVKTTHWPSNEEAAARIASLRLRDAEIGELVRGPAASAHIRELETQMRYLKVLSLIARAKNPWWLIMLAQYIAGAVYKRYLKK